MSSTHQVITVGGDGTILRAAHWAIPHNVPLLGINMGHLGFMTELKAEEALEQVPGLLAGEGWTEERTLLEARVFRAGLPETSAAEHSTPLLALNDVVMGRAALSKVIYAAAYVDGVLLATFKGDGVILATATGSTGYALAAGGPILHPHSNDILLQPISPHLGFRSSLILSGDSPLRLVVQSDHQVTVSVDGQSEYPLQNGDGVDVCRSSQKARFLRRNSPSHFYRTLAQRLGLPTGGGTSGSGSFSHDIPDS